jgi:hypothetical protein
MPDRRVFIESMGSGFYALTAGTSLTYTFSEEKKAFILKEFPDYYKPENSIANHWAGWDGVTEDLISI